MDCSSLDTASPEALGISSQTVLDFIDALEHSGSEMHSMMMMRHGKVFAQGWWSPYAKGVVHAQQSLTKTMTGAAYGAAEKLGILHHDEYVLDLFPEYASLTSGPYWDELKVYHLLTMSCGMESQYPVKAEDWMRGFFTMPIIHRPGTAMYYNSSACSLVGACIRKRSGQSLLSFLCDQVFDKIGIDGSRIKWLCHPDGQENGSGGILSTTEDNVRLMQLFLQHGQWENQQIISRHWADMAVQLQNDHLKRTGPDSPLGYGGMMWIRDNCFYADGGMGQYAVAFPEKDLVIAINETISTPEGERNISNALFHFDRFVANAPLPQDHAAHQRLENRLSRLCIPALAYAKFVGKVPMQSKMHICQGEVPLFADDFKIFSDNYKERVDGFSFIYDGPLLTMRVYSESGVNDFLVSTDGRRWHNHAKTRNPATELCLSACWRDGSTLAFEFRWIESCRLRKVEFRFDNNGADILTTLSPVGGFDEDPWIARAEIVGYEDLAREKR